MVRKEKDMSIVEGSVDLSSEFDQPVETVFAAWSDKEAQLTWGDPGEGWSMAFDAFNFAVGQTDICRFGPDGGRQYVNENRYLVIDCGRRIVYSTSLASEGHVTFAGTMAIAFEARGNGTRLRLIEQGLYFDGEDDVAGHRSGWESMLDALGRFLRG
jgi:uncharacterized protein YndB with AHSA1/START domain